MTSAHPDDPLHDSRTPASRGWIVHLAAGILSGAVIGAFVAVLVHEFYPPASRPRVTHAIHVAEDPAACAAFVLTAMIIVAVALAAGRRRLGTRAKWMALGALAGMCLLPFGQPVADAVVRFVPLPRNGFLAVILYALACGAAGSAAGFLGHRWCALLSRTVRRTTAAGAPGAGTGNEG